MFKDREFAGQQINLLPRADHVAGDKVHHQIASGQRHVLRQRTRAAAKGVDPGRQFAKGKGFDQIIVRTRVQPANAVIY